MSGRMPREDLDPLVRKRRRHLTRAAVRAAHAIPLPLGDPGESRHADPTDPDEKYSLTVSEHPLDGGRPVMRIRKCHVFLLSRAKNELKMNFMIIYVGILTFLSTHRQ